MLIGCPHGVVPNIVPQGEGHLARISAYFSDVFGRSAFPEIQQHASLCVDAADELLNLLAAAGSGKWNEVRACYDRIAQLENEADQVKRKVRSNLPRGFFLPVARTDLLDLLGRQDKIANRAQDVAGIMTGRHIQFPSHMQSQVAEFAEHSVAACHHVRDVVGELGELIDAGFRGPEAKRVLRLIEKVEDDEHRVDELLIEVRASLFALEEQLPPVHVMFFYQVLDLIADLSDAAERVAHSVQMMLAK